LLLFHSAHPEGSERKDIYYCPRMHSKQQNRVKCPSPSALNESLKEKKNVHVVTSSICVQSAKKAPAATRTPTIVAPMPVTLRAPLLPPLKALVAVLLGEVPVEELDTVGTDILLMVELEPELEREELPERVELEFLLPEEVEEEDKEELEEMTSPIENEAVWESTLVTSPIGDAWKVYPEPVGTTGMVTVRVPSAVVTTFFNANV